MSNRMKARGTAGSQVARGRLARAGGPGTGLQRRGLVLLAVRCGQHARVGPGAGTTRAVAASTGCGTRRRSTRARCSTWRVPDSGGQVPWHEER